MNQESMSIQDCLKKASTEQLVKSYIKIRDAIEVLEREHKEAIKQLRFIQNNPGTDPYAQQWHYNAHKLTASPAATAQQHRCCRCSLWPALL